MTDFLGIDINTGGIETRGDDSQGAEHGSVQLRAPEFGEVGYGESSQTHALIIVVSGAHSAEDEVDGPGRLVSELLREVGYDVDGVVTCDADEVAIRNALNTAVIGGVDLVVTVGGVGVGARDVTPEATETLLDRKLAGIDEAMRLSGLSAGLLEAGLSRGVAGISGSTVVVNLPGSRAAIRNGMAALTPLVAHVIEGLSAVD